MAWSILTRGLLAVPIKGAAAASCACCCLRPAPPMCVVIWAVSLGQNGAVDIFLAYFVDRLGCVDGVSIGGYTLGQRHHQFVQLGVLLT